MCGRYTLRIPQNVLAGQLQAELPRYNIAPTQLVLILRGTERQLVRMRWGMGAQTPLINARSETVSTKPRFRDAFRERRCLVPADGFYEWRKSGGHKEPHFIKMLDDRPFTFAGIWTDKPADESFAILTTTANDLVAPLHDRMPVILDPADHAKWLDPATTPEELQSLLRPYPSGKMIAYAVGPRVNTAKNDDPDCLKPRPPDRLLF